MMYKFDKLKHEDFFKWKKLKNVDVITYIELLTLLRVGQLCHGHILHGNENEAFWITLYVLLIGIVAGFLNHRMIHQFVFVDKNKGIHNEAWLR